MPAILRPLRHFFPELSLEPDGRAIAKTRTCLYASIVIGCVRANPRRMNPAPPCSYHAAER